MDFKTDENGQVSMDLGEPTRQRIEIPKTKALKREVPKGKRRVACPQGLEFQEVVQLIMGEEYCRERCGELNRNSYDAMRATYDCVWIRRGATRYGSEATTRNG